MVLDTYKLVVSDPWDFENKSGKNELLGNIVRFIDDKSVIFKANETVLLKNISGCLFVISARHENVVLLDLNKSVSINAGILLAEDYESGTTEEIQRRSKFVIIGSIEKVL